MKRSFIRRVNLQIIFGRSRAGIQENFEVHKNVANRITAALRWLKNVYVVLLQVM